MKKKHIKFHFSGVEESTQTDAPPGKGMGATTAMAPPGHENVSAPFLSTVYLPCPVKLHPGFNRATAYPRVSMCIVLGRTA